MKKVYIALATVAVLLLASCDRKDAYRDTSSFVTFNCESTLTIREDVGSFSLPIRAIGNHGDFSVTVSGIDGTAKSNTHFKISEPASGVINFTAADTVKTVTFEVIRIPGYVDPGSVDFKVNIDNATSGLTRGSRRQVAVTITDADHPLADIIGAWNVKAYDAQSNSTYAEVNYVMNLKAYDGDVTRVWCDGINSFAQTMKGYGITIVDVYGIVSDDHSTISFPCGQEGGDMGSSNGGIVKLVSGYINNGYYVDEDAEAIVFTKQEDGTYKCDQGILWLNDYVWPTYGGYFLGAENGVSTTWTKQ